MIKKIFTYIAALGIFAACSDDFEPRTPGYLGEDGELTISFGVMPATTVTTRSAELPKVDMYVYDNTGLLQKANLTLDANNKATVILSKKVVDSTGAKFYFVGNAPTSVSAESIGTIEEATFNAVAIESGSTELPTVSSIVSKGKITSTVPLYHNGVKVTVNNGVEVFEEGTDSNDETKKKKYTAGEVNYPFVVRGTAKTSKVLAGALSQDNQKTATDYCSPYDNDNLPTTLKQGEQFVHPTLNSTFKNGDGSTNSENERRSYIIVQGEYQGQKYYYRLDFQTFDSSSKTTSGFDLLPHHHYEVLILGIKGAGYNTIEDAALNPAPMVTYEIHDHAPVIYNMISDGTRELGVAKDVTFKDVKFDASGDSKKDVNTTQMLKVKLYTKTQSEYDYFTNKNNWGTIFKIPSNCDWLSVKSIEASTADSDYGDESTEETSGDPNHRGKVYNVTLEVNSTNNPGNLETELVVNWLGLTRPVKVYWTREFNTKTLFSPAVEIRAWEGKQTSWDASNPKFEDSDYFDSFLKTSTVGTSSTANNGKDRADGLHFPMPYGNGAKWTYMYKLTINPAVGSNQPFTWSVETEGVSNLELITPDNKNNDSKDNRTFYITRTADDFDYETGKLILKITQNGKTAEYDNVKLYHTGFFHKDEGKSGSDNGGNGSNGQNYLGGGSTIHSTDEKIIRTYYEVVEIGGNYWLDRNMGATSARMYIKDATGEEEDGGYYMVGAHYWQGEKPIIYKNSVPPGYQVPSTGQWNNLKKASNFSTEQVGSYYYPTARVGDKVVYFPKGKYYEDYYSQGDERAGYYWTRDAASGTEKEEVGNWLKCMQFTGTATSFINGRTQGRPDKDGKKYPPFYMYMRAVANLGGDDQHPEELFFKVKGATHVYLYREDIVNGKPVRTAATTWPGQAVGNFTTAQKEFEFKYETTTSLPGDLKVIFNFVDETGQINTYSKNDFDGIAVSHTNIRPADAEGWRVHGTGTGEFSNVDCKVRIDENSTLKDGKSTNGTFWIVSTPEHYSFRLLWPKGANYKYFRILDEKGNVRQKWSQRTADDYKLNDTYYSWAPITTTVPKFKVEFAATDDDPETIYVPTSGKTYQKTDAVWNGDHSANILNVGALKVAGGTETEVTYRVLWTRHGNYYRINMTGGITTNGFTTPNVSYEKTYNGTKYFCYEFSAIGDFEIKLQFEDNEENGERWKTNPKGNPSYTSASFDKTSDKVKALVITELNYGNIIYFEKSSWSGDPYAYCWSGGSNNGGWPGQKMKKMSGNIYKLETQTNWNNVAFNNNSGTQTGDLGFNNRYLYKQDNSNALYAP